MSQSQKVHCRYCKAKLVKGTRHQCPQMKQRNIQSRLANDDDDGFFVSLAVAAATDDWVIGTVLGGNLTGAIIGDALVDSDVPVIADLDSETVPSEDGHSLNEVGDADYTSGDVSDSY